MQGTAAHALRTNERRKKEWEELGGRTRKRRGAEECADKLEQRTNRRMNVHADGRTDPKTKTVIK